MIGVMNDTKWEEVRLAMYALGSLAPGYRIKERDIEEPCPWDREWYYHFRGTGFETIEWVKLKTPDSRQRDAVREALRAIHVPGVETAIGFRVFGWIRSGEVVDYIS